jgi:23S rRNA (adenine2503-C2)-methyltransferase
MLPTLALVSAALVPILSSTPESMADVVGGKGRARVVWDKLRLGSDPITSPPEELGRQARESLLKHFGSPGYSVLTRSVAPCGTTKLLLQLPLGDEIETVIIPNEEKSFSTLCVSSQVGCRQGCRFCLTGTMGLKRSLDTAEILSQLHAAMHEMRGQGSHLPRLRNVVFMGACSSLG